MADRRASLRPNRAVWRRGRARLLAWATAVGSVAWACSVGVGPLLSGAGTSGSGGRPLEGHRAATPEALAFVEPLGLGAARAAEHRPVGQAGATGLDRASPTPLRPAAQHASPGAWGSSQQLGVYQGRRRSDIGYDTASRGEGYFPFRLWLGAVAARSWARSATRRHSVSNVARGEDPCPDPILYDQRWVQLAFLALLALLSDWVCFSVAAVPEPWTKVFGEGPENLIDLFLFTNVFFCFIEPYAIKAFGLRIPIIGAGLLMAAGCVLRSGVPFVGEVLPEYVPMVAGTMMVAAAQPFFQCTPPLLSATWFAPNERALATAVAINFNQVGIATAFLIGGEMGRTVEGLKPYFDVMTISSIVIALGAIFFFQERPPTPPSTSELEKMEMEAAGGKDDEGFIEQAQKYLSTPGFIQPLSAFVCSIAVTNVVGAFLEKKLANAGLTNPEVVEGAGVGFELAIVVGGIILGGLVDQNKEYKSVTLACLAATVVVVFALGLSSSPPALVLVALLAIGALTGPVQPINAELAVEVTYPADENAIEAIQQLCGNLISALLVPICLYATGYTFSLPSVSGEAPWSVQGDTALLLVLVAGVLGYYSTFSAPLKRTEVDNELCMVTLDDEDDTTSLQQGALKGELESIASTAKEPAGR